MIEQFGKWHLLVHTASSILMVGIIWFVQIIY